MSNMVALPQTPFGELAAAVKPRKIVGDLAHFAKGDIVVGSGPTERTLADGTAFVAIMASLSIGWQCWKGGRLVDEVMGIVAHGLKMPRRNELGDDDVSKWDLDTKSGEPRDPWTKAMSIVLVGHPGGELYTFVTQSRGGLEALGDLAGA